MEQILTYIFWAAAGIQICFWTFIASKLAFYNPQDTHREKELFNKVTHKVSVIICAHNELFNLKGLFQNLKKQIYDNFEVILVDDRSSDGTADFFYKEWAQEARFHLIQISNTPKGHNSKKYALSIGIDAAKGDVILLTDADCLPNSPYWIKEMQEKINDDKQIILGYSPYQKEKGLLNILIRFETIYTAIQYLSYALSGMPYMGVGRNMAYKKEIFTAHNGLEGYTSVTGGDDDLFIGKVANSHNTTIQIKKTAQTISLPKTTLSTWFVQKKRHLHAGRHYSFRNKLITGLLSLSHIALYAGFIGLLFFTFNTWIISAFILRTILFIAIFVKIGHKLEDRIHWIYVGLMDLLFLVYYIYTGVATLLSKEIRWI